MAEMPNKMMGDMASEPEAPETDVAPEGDKPVVVLTVLGLPDGTFKLIQGDENEAIHEEGGEPGAEPEEQGETFDAIGPLLKGALDMLEAYQADSGEGTAEENFNAGFDGGNEASPTKPKKSPAENY